jgi:CelD/BcsL family acetyltransferase involved in cellulose biosynthesis
MTLTAAERPMRAAGGPLRMTDIRATTLDAFPVGVNARPLARSAATGVDVEIVDATKLSGIRSAWIELLDHAESANVFMDPALLEAAGKIFPKVERPALLAWKMIDGRRRLVGLWAFAVGRASPSALPVRVLAAPAAPYGYLATPVIDRSCLDDALSAMLVRLAADPRLPKIIALDAMATDTPTMQALGRVLALRGTVPFILAEGRRPKLASSLDGKTYLEKTLSSGSRKKLRQHRRRLGETGALTSTTASEPAAVRSAFEKFLALEAAGWKGRAGTALFCDDRNAAFVRAAVGALAERGCASIHTLHLNGKPVSMQIVARCGRTAFTWKTAYDEAFHDFSPGMLLLEDYTAAFLADPNVAQVDSCAHDESGFMASAWAERQAIADLWIDVRRGGSLSFLILSSLQKHCRDLRESAKHVYLSLKRRMAARPRQ